MDFGKSPLINNLLANIPDLTDDAAEALKAKIEQERSQDAVEVAKQIQLRGTQRLLGRAAIPKRFEARTFADYAVTCSEQGKALEVCRRYAAGFSKMPMQQGSSLMLIGNTGTGKTHLVAALANEVVTQGFEAIYVIADTMVRDIRSAWGGKGDEQGFIDKYAAPDLLIIDEVGAGQDTDSVKDLFFQVINARYEQVKPTIIVSNLELDTLKLCIGDRVTDRMREAGGMTVVFDWASNRAGG
jgi:DNA replication protein DnaC